MSHQGGGGAQEFAIATKRTHFASGGAFCRVSA
jgi:hypothetical protein